MAKSALDWKSNGQEVDTDGLSPALAKSYAAYKTASGVTRLAREGFEKAFTQAAREAKMLTADQVFAFGYKFGRLTVCVADAVAPKKATKGIKL
jgi:hypothetical protein